MNISKGIKVAPCRAVFYGPEGIGKSTLAAAAPNPLFIDVEEGTEHLDVVREDSCSTFKHVEKVFEELAKDNHGFETVVIDTIDWLEDWAKEEICLAGKKQSIEDFGYGKGFVMLGEKFSRFLVKADKLRASGMHIIFLAHSKVVKYEEPGQAGAYDRHTLKLGKHTEPLIKEWADLLCFCDYKTVLVEGDKGNVAGGGKERMIYTEHTAAFDAKNRASLKPRLPMEFKSLAPAFKYKRGEAPKPKAKITLAADPTAKAKPAPATDPLTTPSAPEEQTQVQLDTLKALWSECSDDNGLNYGSAQMRKLWEWLKTNAPVGNWSNLNGKESAKAIEFLTNKIKTAKAA
jgi:hypothetical protein